MAIVDTHKNHCCELHGCKYGDEDCPVVLGAVTQTWPCEDCAPNPEQIVSVEEAPQIIWIQPEVAATLDEKLRYFKTCDYIRMDAYEKLQRENELLKQKLEQK